MTIRKGERWGTTTARPPDLRTVATDAELAALVESGSAGPFGIAGGDLHRSVGSPAPRDEMQRLPIDVIDVVVDGERVVAVAHVVARRGWWRGGIVAVCNVDRIGGWDVAPRAHPNDGRLDIVEVDGRMTLRQRRQAQRRLATGTHVPHPMINTRTARADEWVFDRPQNVWVDGRRVASVRSLRVEVRPDAAEILV